MYFEGLHSLRLIPVTWCPGFWIFRLLLQKIKVFEPLSTHCRSLLILLPDRLNNRLMNSTFTPRNREDASLLLETDAFTGAVNKAGVVGNEASFAHDQLPRVGHDWAHTSPHHSPLTPCLAARRSEGRWNIWWPFFSVMIIFSHEELPSTLFKEKNKKRQGWLKGKKRTFN